MIILGMQETADSVETDIFSADAKIIAKQERFFPHMQSSICKTKQWKRWSKYLELDYAVQKVNHGSKTYIKTSLFVRFNAASPEANTVQNSAQLVIEAERCIQEMLQLSFSIVHHFNDSSQKNNSFEERLNFAVEQLNGDEFLKEYLQYMKKIRTLPDELTVEFPHQNTNPTLQPGLQVTSKKYQISQIYAPLHTKYVKAGRSGNYENLEVLSVSKDTRQCKLTDNQGHIFTCKELDDSSYKSLVTMQCLEQTVAMDLRESGNIFLVKNILSKIPNITVAVA